MENREMDRRGGNGAHSNILALRALIVIIVALRALIVIIVALRALVSIIFEPAIKTLIAIILHIS